MKEYQVLHYISNNPKVGFNRTVLFVVEEAEKFAAEKGYQITESFGNINESASTDYTRKEFLSYK